MFPVYQKEPERTKNMGFIALSKEKSEGVFTVNTSPAPLALEREVPQIFSYNILYRDIRIIKKT